MPLQRRIPKRGFVNIFRVEYQPVNLSALSKVNSESPITPEVLIKSRLVRKKNQPVKILGNGELEQALEIHAHGFSKSAQEKIEKAGGKVVVLNWGIKDSKD